VLNVTVTGTEYAPAANVVSLVYQLTTQVVDIVTQEGAEDPFVQVYVYPQVEESVAEIVNEADESLTV